MLLKFKYYHDSGMLTPYQSYTLAQNSHLSSKFAITSTDPNAASYNYCLEFVCYNTKNVPKTQYISTVLQYGAEGLDFDIPNNLTQFRGHTDVQLTGYSQTDNSIVFKSVAKNCKAFEVEGSLCVLENSISDTPNVITEILNQLDYLLDIKNNLVQEFLASANAEFGVVLSKYTWHNVTFWNRDVKLKTACYIKGYKISEPPEFVLPKGCVIDGGWYDTTTNKIWDFEVDVVTQDTNICINYYTPGLTFTNSIISGYTGDSAFIYIPRYYGGKPVKSILKSDFKLTFNFNLYVNELVPSIGGFAMTQYLVEAFVHKDNPKLTTDKSCLIDKTTLAMEKFGNVVTGIYFCPSYCFLMKENSFFRSNATRISLPSGLNNMAMHCIRECNKLTELVIPEGVALVANMAVFNCALLKKIYLLPTIPPTISSNSFTILNADLSWTNADLYVPSISLNRYKNSPQYQYYNIFPIVDELPLTV